MWCTFCLFHFKLNWSVHATYIRFFGLQVQNGGGCLPDDDKRAAHTTSAIKSCA
jgi:hypothetical protein